MNKQAGFGLVEVVIAFIVVAVTAGSLLQLNKVYLEYSRDGRSREVALRLAESKLDELKGFQDQTGYEAIASGSNTTKVEDVDYSLGWTVTDYGWNGSAWVSPPPSGVSSGKKDIAVTVDWNDGKGSQTFALGSVVSPNQSTSGGPFGTSAPNTGLGMGGPNVAHTPGAIPDIVSIELDPNTGIKQETTKPAPEVKTGKNSGDVVVSLETVVYNPSNNSLINGNSQTVYCSCTNKSGNKLTRKPSVPISLSQSIYWKNGELASKGWGESENDNNDCEVCCSDHYDVPSSTQFADNYNQFNKGHTHTGTYYESCRMLLIDGLYQVMPDWNLVALNIFPPGYLANVNNVTLYQAYVKYVVKDYVSKLKAGTQSAGYKPDSYSVWLSNNGTQAEQDAFDALTKLSASFSYQFAARAIYVDFLPQALLDNVDFTDSDWLTRVSFNEVNVTLLANWSVTLTDGVFISVTQEPVKTIVDPENQYFGTYSRGYVKAKAATPTPLITKPKVTASMTRYNTGLTGQSAISTFDGSNVYSANLGLSVSGVPVTTVTFSGKIECLTKDKGQSTAAVACGNNGFGKTTVTSVNGTCTITQGAGAATSYYECTVPTAPTITVTFSETSNNSSFVFNVGGTNPRSINLNATDISIGNIPCVLQVHTGIQDYDEMSCTP